MKAAERRLELRGIFERQEFADLATLRKRLKAAGIRVPAVEPT